ncbi:MAG: hypothetical protein QW794_00485 [Thermosphaera sp.]
MKRRRGRNEPQVDVLSYLKRRALESRGTAFSCTPAEVARGVFGVEKPTPLHLNHVSRVLQTLTDAGVATLWGYRHGRKRFVIDKRKLLEHLM